MHKSGSRRKGMVLKLAPPVIIAIIFLALWQALVVGFKIPPYLVPSPWLTLKTLVTDWKLLGGSTLFTLKITVYALILATIIGIAVSFLFVQSRILERALFPYAVLLQVTPIVAIAPLIIIWVNNTVLALVICATLVAIFPIISNTTLGLRSVNPGLLSYFQLQGASRIQILLRLRVPTALPHFFAALKIASGLSLIGAVVAEFVAGTGGSNTGLAYQILQASYQLNIPRMFAALVLISAIGIALFLIMSYITRLVIGKWHEAEQE